MRVFKSLQEKFSFINAVITIGTFDGVHAGHRHILHRVEELAKKINGESVIITFNPHPRQIINPNQPLYNLNTLDEKLELLKSLHIDNVIVVPFSREFSEMDAGKYIEEFLISKFHPKIIVFGYDHHFGKNREGDIKLLKSICVKDNIEVEEIPEQVVHHITISSTKIRSYLLQGKITNANELLGYDYTLTGLVVKGEQIGRTLGYPTANLHIHDTFKLIPADGVYAVRCYLKNQKDKMQAMMSIGYRPTFNGTSRSIEVNIFNFNQTIYGEELTVEFVEFLRKEEKFSTKEELIHAMEEDKKKTFQLFNSEF